MSESHSLACAGDAPSAVRAYAPGMGRILFPLAAALSVLSASARQITIPTQPVSQYADTEVATNVVVQSSRTDVREVKLHIQFEGTPTNDLEVAFGRDANANGILDISEVETVYGWRGGRYFIENVRGWDRIETEAATNGVGGFFDVQLKNDRDFVPARFAATCGISPERSEPRQRSLEGCSAAFVDFAANPPAWLFRREWNMMRVVRRGTGVPSEWVRCFVDHEFFDVRLR